MRKWDVAFIHFRTALTVALYYTGTVGIILFAYASGEKVGASRVRAKLERGPRPVLEVKHSRKLYQCKFSRTCSGILAQLQTNTCSLG